MPASQLCGSFDYFFELARWHVGLLVDKGDDIPALGPQICPCKYNGKSITFFTRRGLRTREQLGVRGHMKGKETLESDLTVDDR